MPTKDTTARSQKTTLHPTATKKINILGLNGIAYDSSACLIQDGRLVAAIEEERLSRKKHTNVFPVLAINRCLDMAGLELRDIDYITLNWNPRIGLVQRALVSLRHSPLSLFGLGVPDGRGSMESLFKILRLSKRFEEHFGVSSQIIKRKIYYVAHHLAHISSSYFVSGFNQSAFLSMDGAGEWATTVMGMADGLTLSPLKTINFPHSIGFFYQALTHFLGFRAIGGEGTVMGLAAYGNNRYAKEFDQLYELLPDGGFRIDQSFFDYLRPDSTNFYSDKLIRLLGEPRFDTEPLSQRHFDIAASLQNATETIGLHLAAWLYEKTKCRNICISGGVGLNCTMNGRIFSSFPYENIFVQPAVNDAGGCIGSALYLYHSILNNPLSCEFTHSYWGAAYDNDEILTAVGKYDLDYNILDTPERTAAELIADQKIVGWFQGRMEFGPRALGNRSILADPRRAEMKDRINSAVKHREMYRPFAPAVLKENAAECFVMKTPTSPFMLLTFPVRPQWLNRVPAIVHKDGSARVQTVSRDTNARFWNLIQEFKILTGIPLVLNTSFNDLNEPIVESPEDAIKCFLGTKIDELIMGNIHISRNA